MLRGQVTSIALGDNEKSVILEWDKVEGATHYIVYGRNQEEHALAIVGETSWEDNGINLELDAEILISSIKNPWGLPKSPIKPYQAFFECNRNSSKLIELSNN